MMTTGTLLRKKLELQRNDVVCCHFTYFLFFSWEVIGHLYSLDFQAMRSYQKCIFTVLYFSMRSMMKPV